MHARGVRQSRKKSNGGSGGLCALPFYYQKIMDKVSGIAIIHTGIERASKRKTQADSEVRSN